MSEEEAIRQIVADFYAAVNELQRGDPTLLLALWSRGTDVTQFAPRGRPQRGWEEIEGYYRRAAEVAGKSSNQVTAAGHDLLIRVHGDLAYTCAREEVTIIHEGGISQTTPRATHIYRREAGTWKLIHRHTDAVGD
jgi:ketosteroid isomerase-like protein